MDYRVGVYVRESRDDNGENYETIETQRDLLLEYVRKSNLGCIHRIYMDDNVSGSGFERKGLGQLKEDILSGEINLLVLKDLSRLGRNNAKTLLFLDFLEEHGVRVITFDGKYDSLRDNDTVGIETWFNERYIKDLSKKIRTNLRFKIEKGEYIGHAPYGYKKLPEQKNRLYIDENAAPVVREIYRLYREGYGYGHIAGLLNAKGGPAPSGRAGGWNPVAVQRILGSRVYVGDTVQGVSEKISFKSKKTRRLPRSRWVVTTGTHEPIISRAEFEEVQEIRKARGAESGAHKGSIHLLRGILYCGGCGSAMFARVRKNRPTGYICSSYGKHGRSACTSHHIGERVVEEILLEELEALFEDKELREKVKGMLEKESCKNRDYRSERVRLGQQLAAKQRQQEALYLDKLEGKISEQLFLRTNTTIENRISQLYREMEELKAGECEAGEFDAEKVIGQMLSELRETGLTNEMVRLMADRIEVFEAGDGGFTSAVAVQFRYGER